MSQSSEIKLRIENDIQLVCPTIKIVQDLNSLPHTDQIKGKSLHLHQQSPRPHADFTAPNKASDDANVHHKPTQHSHRVQWQLGNNHSRGHVGHLLGKLSLSPQRIWASVHSKWTLLPPVAAELRNQSGREALLSAHLHLTTALHLSVCFHFTHFWLPHLLPVLF